MLNLIFMVLFKMFYYIIYIYLNINLIVSKWFSKSLYNNDSHSASKIYPIYGSNIFSKLGSSIIFLIASIAQ